MKNSHRGESRRAEKSLSPPKMFVPFHISNTILKQWRNFMNYRPFPRRFEGFMLKGCMLFRVSLKAKLLDFTALLNKINISKILLYDFREKVRRERGNCPSVFLSLKMRTSTFYF